MSTYLTLGGKSLSELPAIPTNLVTTDGGEGITISWNNNENLGGLNIIQVWNTNTLMWVNSGTYASGATEGITTGTTAVDIGTYNVRVAVFYNNRYYPSLVKTGRIIDAPPSGAVAVWRFEDNLNDDSSNDYDLVATSVSPVYVTGKVDLAIKATSDYYVGWLTNSDIGLASTFTGTSEFSISSWMYVGSTTEKNIFNIKSDSTPLNVLNLKIGENSTYQPRMTGSLSEEFNAGLSTSNWYHILFIFNGTSTKVYINNVEKLSYNETTAITGANNITLVSYALTNDMWDNTYIYPRALDETDRAKLYNSGSGI